VGLAYGVRHILGSAGYRRGMSSDHSEHAGTRIVVLAAVLLYVGSSPAMAQRRYEVVRTLPHDTRAFTQGLVYHDGYLFEGTGRRGQSAVRKLEIGSGRVLQQASLPPTMFGEGIAIFEGKVYQLTWLSGVGVVRDLDSLLPLRQFRQVSEGWGLTHDGEHLIQSDGSDRLYFLDPETLELVREVDVRESGTPVTQLNELEYIDGQVFANIWHSDDIVRIDPRSGEVRGRIDMSGLLGTPPGDPEAVLNGIAYDAASGRVWVTGKLWPRIFEVRFLGGP